MKLVETLRCDVAVVGAGAAGIAAAVAAAKAGAEVVLIERHGFTGGLATTAMVGGLTQGASYVSRADFARLFGN